MTMRSAPVLILWETSHIWGLLALRAFRALGLDCRLVKSIDITQRGILGKGARLVVAPGGSARLKASALGKNGLAALRKWIFDGGNYLGFCGGAGFALNSGGEDCLAICPWKRSAYSKRIEHLLSGHVNAQVGDTKMLLPIWWPGRFAPDDGKGVRTLVTYSTPGPDLWLGDMPLAGLPDGVSDLWAGKWGVNIQESYPEGLPLIIEGNYGKGRYVLSYSHLETPQSGAANSLLCQLLEEYFNVNAISRIIPEWSTGVAATRQQPERAYKIFPEKENSRLEIKSAHEQCTELMETGIRLGFFFRRHPWLSGWQIGMPGMVCNALLAMLSELRSLPFQPRPAEAWGANESQFKIIFKEFIEKAGAWLWTERMKRTFDIKNDDASMRESIFGHPMTGGGFAGRLIAMTEELIYIEHNRML